MAELTLDIGGRLFEVACEDGQEAALEKAAKLLDREAQQVSDGSSAATEKRMLLLSGLMLADTMLSVQEEMAGLRDELRSAEERVRIAEAKSAMLTANAGKGEARASIVAAPDQDALRAENEAAMDLLARVLEDINELAEQVEGKGA